MGLSSETTTLPPSPRPWARKESRSATQEILKRCERGSMSVADRWSLIVRSILSYAATGSAKSLLRTDGISVCAGIELQTPTRKGFHRRGTESAEDLRVGELGRKERIGHIE